MSNHSSMKKMGGNGSLYSTIDNFEIPLKDVKKSWELLTKEAREAMLKEQVQEANGKVKGVVHKWKDALDNVETTVDELLERNNTILKCKLFIHRPVSRRS